MPNKNIPSDNTEQLRRAVWPRSGRHHPRLSTACLLILASLSGASQADFLTADPPFTTLDAGVPVGSSVLAILSIEIPTYEGIFLTA